MRKITCFLLMLIILFNADISCIFASENSNKVQIVRSGVISPYNSERYIVSYKVKNTGNTDANNVIIICNIVDGYGKTITSLTQNAGVLKPGQEYEGEFYYYRSDTSFIVYHVLSVK